MFAVQRRSPSRFVPSCQEEARSRLLYVLEQHRPLAMLWGETGVGKTTLLGQILSELSHRQFGVMATIDVSGYSSAELATELANHVGSVDSPGWSSLEDWLLGSQEGNLPSLWILDHLDLARDDLRLDVRRLVRLIERTRAAATVIVAARSRQYLESLAELADLQVPVGCWDELTTRTYLEDRSQHRGASSRPLTASARSAMWDCTSGRASLVSRLYELTQLAAQVHDKSNVEAELVVSVWNELLSEDSVASSEIG